MKIKIIKNLKDPTALWTHYNYMLFITIVLVIFSRIKDAQGIPQQQQQQQRQQEQQYNNNETLYKSGWRNRRDYTGPGLMQNVTCIAHDTKYTCDCHNVNQPLQLPYLDGLVYQVEITNCRSLTIEANALKETQGLRKINFKNIDNLVLQKYALEFPRYASNIPLIIEFEKVNFELIDSNAINGNIEEIAFMGGRIDIIHPFAFTTIRDRAIVLKMNNLLIKQIKSQAFKKFAVEQVEITNCIFDSNIPSKAFYEVEVLNTLVINNVKFKNVHSKAFSFQMINKLSITNNDFTGVDGEWIEAKIRESILINGNYFGLTSEIAFKGISIHKDYMSSENLEFRLFNNTISAPTQSIRPLQFNERFLLSIKRLQYENEFSCSLNIDMSQKPPKPNFEFFAQYADSIYFIRDNPTNNNNNNDRNNPMAKKEFSNQSYIVLSKIIEWDCKQRSYVAYILIGICVLILVLIGICIAIWAIRAKKREKRKMDIVLPEPRTYKETQIVYQIENAGLLKTDL